eukprot:Clim_evm25s7 gene=Clim_evmTU25s7
MSDTFVAAQCHFSPFDESSGTQYCVFLGSDGRVHVWDAVPGTKGLLVNVDLSATMKGREPVSCGFLGWDSEPSTGKKKSKASQHKKLAVIGCTMGECVVIELDSGKIMMEQLLSNLTKPIEHVSPVTGGTTPHDCLTLTMNTLSRLDPIKGECQADLVALAAKRGKAGEIKGLLSLTEHLLVVARGRALEVWTVNTAGKDDTEATLKAKINSGHGGDITGLTALGKKMILSWAEGDNTAMVWTLDIDESDSSATAQHAATFTLPVPIVDCAFVSMPSASKQTVLCAARGEDNRIYYTGDLTEAIGDITTTDVTTRKRKTVPSLDIRGQVLVARKETAAKELGSSRKRKAGPVNNNDGNRGFSAPFTLLGMANSSGDRLVLAHGSALNPAFETFDVGVKLLLASANGEMDETPNGDAESHITIIERTAAGNVLGNGGGSEGIPTGNGTFGGAIRAEVLAVDGVSTKAAAEERSKRQKTSVAKGTGDAADSGPSLAEQLAAVSGSIGSASKAAASSAMVAGTTAAGQSITIPSTASVTHLLVQALHSEDARLLEEILQGATARQISPTVAKLPVAYVLPLLHQLGGRLERKPNRAAALLPWLRSLFQHHLSYLITVPDLQLHIAPLQRIITARLGLLQPLMSLSGRLDLLISQMNAAAGTGVDPLEYGEDEDPDRMPPMIFHDVSDSDDEDEDEESDEDNDEDLAEDRDAVGALAAAADEEDYTEESDGMDEDGAGDEEEEEEEDVDEY